ncbi:MAG: modB [Candidatus Angelobacter sp.]|nr:modB [Candidatus Angelobacter sp.]
MNWQAVALTAKLASLVSLILLVLGLPLAYWIAYSRWRWKFLVEAVVALPLVLPPTVLGFYVLVAIGAQSPIGRWYQHWTGHSFAFSFQGLLIASVLYSLPFAVQPFAVAFAQVDRNLLAASSVLGSSRTQTFFRIIMPLSLTGILAGVILSFAHTVGEFGVVLMVGGNIPGVTQTISIDIYDRVQDLDYAAANQTALLLLAFSFIVLSVVYAANRQLWRGWLSK